MKPQQETIEPGDWVVIARHKDYGMMGYVTHAMTGRAGRVLKIDTGDGLRWILASRVMRVTNPPPMMRLSWGYMERGKAVHP